MIPLANPQTGQPANGAILYCGPSVLDGAPIVLVAVGLDRASTNAKTGDMVQTYILPALHSPIDAAASGDDVSVCGDCKQRPANGGACYVTLMHGPRAVFAGLQRGIYPDVSGDAQALQSIGRGRMVRLGTYGDPMAVPAGVWLQLVAFARGTTGYTHQWQNPAIPATQWRTITSLCMASVDSDTEAVQARDAGLRYFRVRPDAAAPVGPREMVCPASHEAGKRLTCAECGACNGTRSDTDRRTSVVIIAHGPKVRRIIPLVQSTL